ncbi:MAG: hypothetical protein RMK19_05360 [Bacteroidia bacterium]|nr:hypothetical protein [Bacteroidia bacterium]MDW8015421.1 hypothetical protein [Bacteroidia bacterium]
MKELFLVVWAQMQVGLEGSLGIAHRIPVPRSQPWKNVFLRVGGEQRYPGLHAGGGVSLRYLYEKRRFLGSGGLLRLYEVKVGGREERFLVASVPVHWGTQIGSSAWRLWGGLLASFLLQAQSQPEAVQVYRFLDYFSSSQLQLHSGIEWRWTSRRTIGLQTLWDITPAWDRILFQSSRTLAHHLVISLSMQYAIWEGQ